MTKSVKLYYKTCREQACISQEEAASGMNMEAGTLSRYENGHIEVPEDVVAKMIVLYRTPSLATWHVRHVNPNLAQYFPVPPRIETDGDMMLRLEWAVDDATAVRDGLSALLRGDRLTYEAAEKKKAKARTLRATGSKHLEIAGYLDEQAMAIEKKIEGGA